MLMVACSAHPHNEEWDRVAQCMTVGQIVDEDRGYDYFYFLALLISQNLALSYWENER